MQKPKKPNAGTSDWEMDVLIWCSGILGALIIIGSIIAVAKGAGSPGHFIYGFVFLAFAYMMKQVRDVT